MIYDQPQALRLAVRDGNFRQPTSGHAGGYLQANLMIVPEADAFDFLLFCQRNPKPCPLIEVLEPGATEPRCAPGANIATDVPGYRVYRHGDLAGERESVADLWQKDFVTFLIGCSFSFEAAVQQAGVPLRHVRQGRNVAMYRTNIACTPAGRFSGEMVVSMRPVKSRDVAKVVEISGRFDVAHGTPVHIGNPGAIGIVDIARPDYGDAVDIEADEVPVFWACGVTPQWVAQKCRLPLCITHAPGKMFVTDLRG
ncbi:putative hydro-lyase [Ramlibacter albus]|uniref:Putative hydro-lyase H8R02_20665 n=1 Tax=Ramlibacter albus TaxID=2079448 RepID=A0A923MAX9_9BURK|nr:putative hydro-lyase [Ramlibacter albus]MBC5766891.1 putative hydro-lyase [Ramlibacter albus]